ncbi:MAG TPA: hypothetical protein VKX17_01110 [Planctomycetota bacterium]|nr:hypothetical protein [Planctomycetota bacterium]
MELSATEKKFLKRIVAKFGSTRRKPLLQSLIVITALVTAAHLIERSGLPWWAAFALIYAPTIYLFSRYRRFGIFKSKLMRKLALREEAFAERRSS